MKKKNVYYENVSLVRGKIKRIVKEEETNVEIIIDGEPKLCKPRYYENHKLLQPGMNAYCLKISYNEKTIDVENYKRDNKYYFLYYIKPPIDTREVTGDISFMDIIDTKAKLKPQISIGYTDAKDKMDLKNVKVTGHIELFPEFGNVFVFEHDGHKYYLECKDCQLFLTKKFIIDIDFATKKQLKFEFKIIEEGDGVGIKHGTFVYSKDNGDEEGRLFNLQFEYIKHIRNIGEKSRYLISNSQIFINSFGTYYDKNKDSGNAKIQQFKKVIEMVLSSENKDVASFQKTVTGFFERRNSDFDPLKNSNRNNAQKKLCELCVIHFGEKFRGLTCDEEKAKEKKQKDDKQQKQKSKKWKESGKGRRKKIKYSL